jgi:FtsZ-interacting cell division protein ZipA
MNDLQLALLVLGGVLVAGVYGHGKWQEHRQRKLASGMLGAASGDALLDATDGRSAKRAEADQQAPAERREPTLGALKGAGDGPAPAEAPVAGAGAVERPAEATAGRVQVDPGEPGLPLLSAEVDYIASFSLVEPVSGAMLDALPRDAFVALKKRVAWIGFDERHHAWERVHPQGRYRLLRCGLQLADRGGPLSSPLLDQFKKAVEKVGDDLTAVPEMPNARDAIVRAVRLDRLCAEVDIQLNVYIAPRHEPLDPDAVRDAAMQIGFRLGSDGVFGYPDAGGQRLFSLQVPMARIADGLPAPMVGLLLEVPCVERGEIAFDRMMAVGQELAEALDGLVVDEQRRPITDRFVLPVREQIRELQAKMATQGVEPGSPLALRLFS